MKDYVILYDSSPKGLTEKIKKALKDGWELHGALCVAHVEGKPVVIQAMVLR